MKKCLGTLVINLNMEFGRMVGGNEQFVLKSIHQNVLFKKRLNEVGIRSRTYVPFKGKKKIPV